MILLGIDDTDMPDSLGTNQLGKRIATALSELAACRWIVRHQLCTDAAIPCTSQNGSASLWFEADGHLAQTIFNTAKRVLADNFVDGSDPGIALAFAVSPAVVAFGRQAQTEIVTQSAAREIAAAEGIWLEGLGGTNGGIIGALAALGLAATGNDGRIVQHGRHGDRRGLIAVSELLQMGIRVVEESTGESLTDGVIDLQKKLRPNLRQGEAVLFVERTVSGWRALKRQ